MWVPFRLVGEGGGGLCLVFLGATFAADASVAYTSSTRSRSAGNGT